MTGRWERATVADLPELDPDGVQDVFAKDIRIERVDHGTRIIWRTPHGKGMRVRAKIVVADADLQEIVLMLAQVIHSKRRA